MQNETLKLSFIEMYLRESLDETLSRCMDIGERADLAAGRGCAFAIAQIAYDLEFDDIMNKAWSYFEKGEL